MCLWLWLWLCLCLRLCVCACGGDCVFSMCVSVYTMDSCAPPSVPLVCVSVHVYVSMAVFAGGSVYLGMCVASPCVLCVCVCVCV